MKNVFKILSMYLLVLCSTTSCHKDRIEVLEEKSITGQHNLKVGIGQEIDEDPYNLGANGDFLRLIALKEKELLRYQGEVCNEVDRISGDVSSAGNLLSIPNYVRFVEIGERIGQLNSEFHDKYVEIMESLIEEVTINHWCGTPIPNGSGFIDADAEEVWDIIEDNYFNLPNDYASICFEQKFNFRSYRAVLAEQELAWLDNSELDMSENPVLESNLDEEFWTLVSPDLNVHIVNTTLNMHMFSENAGKFDFKKILDFIKKIKDIVDIIKPIIEFAQDVINFITQHDCAGSTKSNTGNRFYNKRDGHMFTSSTGHKGIIGYKLVQKGVVFDFAKTKTKIKGKVKLYRKKRHRNKYKRDTKNRVWIQYCTKQFNACEEIPFPADRGSYVSAIYNQAGKTSIKEYHPFALQIRYSFDYLSFSMGFNNEYVTTKPLLGNNIQRCESKKNDDPCSEGC